LPCVKVSSSEAQTVPIEGTLFKTVAYSPISKWIQGLIAELIHRRQIIGRLLPPQIVEMSGKGMGYANPCGKLLRLLSCPQF